LDAKQIGVWNLYSASPLIIVRKNKITSFFSPADDSEMNYPETLYIWNSGEFMYSSRLFEKIFFKQRE